MKYRSEFRNSRKQFNCKIQSMRQPTIFVSSVHDVKKCQKMEIQNSRQKTISSCQNLANCQKTCNLHVKQRCLHFSDIQVGS